ncbi:predicted protein [Naegleria gruberi]|uniref:Predicted protein n=1 Tax=Naegleria gruberi TaxID=5762 RepID=D2VNC1_NAEGR|nr:uncharacterized protein NAEGRDRAFT_70443 [Naegleria gruberi]EFC41713.1 predicted protein [Naegleria gruberi]|eukprot:XP_002674457.1 predicted protein [Naegleria gruberi strain NEG-M]
MLSTLMRRSIKKNFPIPSLMVMKRYHQQSMFRLQQQESFVEQEVSVTADLENTTCDTRDSKANSLFARLIKLSDLDPQLKSIIGQYRNDLESYSIQMEKETAHRIFECNLRVQQYLRNAGDRKQEYDNRFLRVLDCELADECASMNKQLEKQIFTL